MSVNICWSSQRIYTCSFPSINKRKVSLAYISLLLLFLQGTNCQDQQTNSSTPVPNGGNGGESGNSVQLYSCCGIDVLEDESVSNSGKENDEDSSCKSFDKPIGISGPMTTITINSSSFTVLKEKKEFCPKNSRWRVDIPITGEIVASENSGVLFANGYLQRSVKPKEYYAPDEFCIDKITKDHVELRGCPTDCEKRVCIVKCCSPDKVLTLRIERPEPKMGCELIGNPGVKVKPPLYHDYSTKFTEAEELSSSMPHYIQVTPMVFKHKCYNHSTTIVANSEMYAEKISSYMGRVSRSEQFRLRSDGAILYRHINGECKTRSENFCTDGIQTWNFTSKEPIEAFTNREVEMIVISCLEGGSLPGAVSKIFGPLMLSVSIFPLLTILVYVLLWKKQTVHGWTIVSTSTSLLFMYIFIGTSHVIRESKGTSVHNTPGCVFVGVAAHFFFLSTFSWLTVMCADLWWTFRTLSPRKQRGQGIQQFIIYAIFGWGLPTVIIIVSLIINTLYMEDDCNNLIVPAYGREACYLTDRAMGVYLYYPGIALLSINLIFFTVTCLKLYQYRQSCQMASKTDMKECFSRFTKLFIVMGCTWIFEIISWCAEGLGLRWYWAIFDIINILRAAAVFVIYVCKKDILNSLEESYPKLKKISGRARSNALNLSDISKDAATTTSAISAQGAGPSISQSPSRNSLTADVNKM